MKETHLNKIEEERVNQRRTAEEVVKVKIDFIRDVLNEIEHMYTTEYIALSHRCKKDVWMEIRERIKDAQSNETELSWWMVRMMANVYHNVMDCLYE